MLGKIAIGYLVAGVVARVYALVRAKDSFEEKTGYKLHTNVMNYFKAYNFKKFISDGIKVVAWPINLGLSIFGASWIENMSDEEFYERFPQYKKYKRK